MNGDEVRDVMLESSGGYDASQVDDLSRAVVEAAGHDPVRAWV